MAFRVTHLPMEDMRMDAIVEKQDAETQLVVSAPGDDEKHNRTAVRTVAFGMLAIGWGVAYWLWPSVLDSPGAPVYLISSGLTTIGATALAISIWK